jgi:hypothetical protein
MILDIVQQNLLLLSTNLCSGSLSWVSSAEVAGKQVMSLQEMRRQTSDAMGVK